MGSSPLTRGKQTPTREVLHLSGLIPAHAGKTRRDAGLASSSWAHPRSRGENLIITGTRGASAGSSPLTRGKREAPADLAREIRLIPAHAGKTLPASCVVPARTAHPRSRGENPYAPHRLYTHPGSSPLTRGKPTTRRVRHIAVRLIPAHAGKTDNHPTQFEAYRAHPRSRGENDSCSSKPIDIDGSSPLTRGKRRRGCVRVVRRRLIPAHAGKTIVRCSCYERLRAHPRSRGENSCGVGRGCYWLGSSPLTRGKRQRSGWSFSVFRLIPAHAGKTTGRQSSAERLPAHPRSRGENRGSRGPPHGCWGSSPLTRGKHVPVVQGNLVGGLIPAHAGKTPFSD